MTVPEIGQRIAVARDLKSDTPRFGWKPVADQLDPKTPWAGHLTVGLLTHVAPVVSAQRGYLVGKVTGLDNVFMFQSRAWGKSFRQITFDRDQGMFVDCDGGDEFVSSEVAVLEIGRAYVARGVFR